ncbi:MAG: hypothetical protein WD628_03880, partial [Thermomicrobiales bacterium]
LVDHYFFNPQFPQMATLFWVLAGTVVGIVAPSGYERARQGVSSSLTNGGRFRRRRRAIGAAPTDGG